MHHNYHVHNHNDIWFVWIIWIWGDWQRFLVLNWKSIQGIWFYLYFRAKIHGLLVTIFRICEFVKLNVHRHSSLWIIMINIGSKPLSHTPFKHILPSKRPEQKQIIKPKGTKTKQNDNKKKKKKRIVFQNLTMVNINLK